MSAKAISHKKLTDTLALSEMKNGYWLYDKFVTPFKHGLLFKLNEA